MSGDRACTSGDLPRLQGIAARLAELAAEPLHHELRAFAESTNLDPAQATCTWMRIRDRIARESV
ncbi:MAG: hypothetical protein NT062_15415 [Proteobacteria bacterium]|nr:hypothetical protein [Pseudomonadota bacterium]